MLQADGGQQLLDGAQAVGVLGKHEHCTNESISQCTDEWARVLGNRAMLHIMQAQPPSRP